jgi:anti-sigma B factor antagonist
MSSPQDISVETEHTDDGGTRITVRGELDFSVAARLEESILEARNGGEPIVLDLSGVTFLDSSALRALVSAGVALKDSGVRLQVGPRSEAVSRILEITGLDDAADAFDVLPGEG